MKKDAYIVDGEFDFERHGDEYLDEDVEVDNCQDDSDQQDDTDEYEDAQEPFYEDDFLSLEDLAEQEYSYDTDFDF